MSNAICPCGNTIEQRKRGAHRKFCTTCRPARIDARVREYIPTPPRINSCQVPDCGATFVSKVPAKYCSNACRQKSKYLPGGTYWKNPITCADCDKEIPRWPKSVQGKTRCPDCSSKASQSAKHGTRKMYRKFKCRCDECRDFINSSCREYAKLHQERTGESLYRNYRDPKLRKLGADRRRAQILSAFVEDVDPARVFEADGYRCYGCGRKCLKGAPNNHLLQPTIDHVVPLSKGGTHEYANCRTMCRQCNCTKGNRGGGEQLLLIG